jgi:ankyrin repeat protein
MSMRVKIDAMSELMQALYQGKTDEAKTIAESRSDLDVFEAAAIGDAGRLRTLLDENPSLANAWSDDGFTPLHFAAFFGHPEAARLLIERGADLEARSTNREFALNAAPLHSAVAARQRDVIEVLLDAGADVNAVQHAGYTPLLEAAQSGDSELVELLLERGADPDAKLDDGRTATDLARDSER